MNALGEHFKQYEGTGTVFGSINKQQFESMEFVGPGLEVLDLFERTSKPLDDRIELNISESESLAQLRDLLLPKLMSGEIRLREAENLVEAVA
jgi:type I restriction enzyme S subunit